MEKFKNAIKEIAAKKLNKKIEEIKHIDFSETMYEDCRIGVTAWVYIDNYVYFFTEDKSDEMPYYVADTNIQAIQQSDKIPYYAVANTNIQAIQQFAKDAENLEMFKEERKRNFMAGSFNEKQIADCLIESYSRQIEPIIKRMAKAKAQKIVEENSTLQINYYDNINSDLDFGTDEAVKVDDNNFLICGKIDKDKFFDFAKLHFQLEQLRAECMEEDI